MSEDGFIAGVPESVVKICASVVSRSGERAFKVRLKSEGKAEVNVEYACYDVKRGRWWGKINAKTICYWRAQPPNGIKLGKRILSWLPV